MHNTPVWQCVGFVFFRRPLGHNKAVFEVHVRERMLVLLCCGEGEHRGGVFYWHVAQGSTSTMVGC